MLDQDTTRLLVSEALKDRLAIKENDQSVITTESMIVIELFLTFEDDKLSFTGPVIDIEVVSNSAVCIQLKSSIQDGYELFSILNQNIYKCAEYNMNYLEHSVGSTGPYKISLQKMTNFDYVKNQCLLSIELIKIEQ